MRHNWHNGARRLAAELASGTYCPLDTPCPAIRGVKNPSCVACWMRWAQRTEETAGSADSRALEAAPAVSAPADEDTGV